MTPAEPAGAVSNEAPRQFGAVLGFLRMVVDRLNGVAAVASSIAFAVAGCILTWEATARYFFKIPSDWQDESTVILLVGATFLSAAWVQTRRGHVGIGVISEVLPAGVERIRQFIGDAASLVFCAFFCWKTWSLWIDAWVEGRTSDSAFSPPLWIPYGLMALGASLLVAELAVQTLAHFAPGRPRRP